MYEKNIIDVPSLELKSEREPYDNRNFALEYPDLDMLDKENDKGVKAEEGGEEGSGATSDNDDVDNNDADDDNDNDTTASMLGKREKCYQQAYCMSKIIIAILG